MALHQHGRIISILTVKSLKLFVRSRSYQFFWVMSLGLLFGGFTFMHYLMKGSFTTHLTSDPYTSLKVTFDCRAIPDHSTHKNQKYSCHPGPPAITKTSDNDTIQNQKSFSDLLMNVLYTGHLVPHEEQEAETMIDLVTSWMMNGLPLVGLDDYVYLSDWARETVDHNSKEELMDSPIFRSQFDNFMNIRYKQIIFTPNNSITNEFVDYLSNHSMTFQHLNYSILQSFDDNQLGYDIGDNIWAIIDLSTDPTTTAKSMFLWNTTIVTPSNQSEVDSSKHIPVVTIRMNPGSVPDTRNLEWTPIKDSNPREQSGELLYFTSGFMSIQLEVQNFLRSRKYHKLPIDIRAVEEVGKYATAKFIDSPVFTMLRKLTASNETWTVAELLRSMSTISQWNKDYTMRFPLYHRAFPTHSYQQSLYWHIFGILMPIALIVSFSLPAALGIGNYLAESKLGVLDVLSTMPNIWRVHSFCAWNLSSIVVIMVYSGIAWIFFEHVLNYSESWIPPVVLFLFGCSTGSIGVILGAIVTDADSLVLALPCFIFITTLPGIVYYEAAVDTERSFVAETLLCLLPPSAAALSLRVIFSHESIGNSVDWNFPAPVSRVPISYYCFLLLVDAIFYYIIAYLFTYLAERKRKVLVTGPQGAQSLSGIHTTESLDEKSIVTAGTFQPLRNLWTFAKSKFQEVRTTFDNQSSDDLTSTRSRSRESLNLNFYQAESASDYIRLRASDLVKQYTTAELNITVLSDISLELYNDCVTVLLGSNGAGKTTLMKIIAGLDQNFRGSISRIPLTRDAQRRDIGWCPQNDALFDYLTVYEHVILFRELFECSEQTDQHSSMFQTLFTGCWTRSKPAVTNKQVVMKLLKNVDLHQQHRKYVHQLSGGMKRRLSLTLAFIGDPVILLLDEPTSGCDSWTRELLRKDILSKKDDTAVLISTHHIDDIEVLAERVWFLNENHLEIDDWARNILRNASPLPTNDGHKPQVESTLFFSTSDEKIKNLFKKYVQANTVVNTFDSSTNETVFEMPQSDETFRRFLVHIETLASAGKWKVESRNLFKSLTKLYHDNSNDSSNDSQQHPITNKFLPPTPLHSQPWERIWCHFYTIFYVRWLEVKVKAIQYLMLHIILPFLVIYLLGYSCQDAIFPKTEISSQSQSEGIGEICIASSNPKSVIPSMLATIQTNASQEDSSRNLFFRSFTWKGIESSSTLWKQLFKEYYHHPINRWGAIVMNDTIENWLDISLHFHNISLYEYVDDVSSKQKSNLLQDLFRFQQSLCNLTSPQVEYNLNQSTIAVKICNTLDTSKHHSSSMVFMISNLNISTSDLHSVKHAIQHNNISCLWKNCAMQLSLSENLATNITLLSNVTTDHAAPIFLKEIIFPLHDWIDEAKLQNQKKKETRDSLNTLDTLTAVADDDDSNPTTDFPPILNSPAEYRLFSHPLPKSSFISKNSLQRGVLGATLMVMYIMINTVLSVRFLISMKVSGMKRQFHLAGMHPCVYIVGQYIVEAMLLFLTLLTIYLSIYCTQDPIHSFFFSCHDIFFVCLLSFLFAILASNYFFVIQSNNQLSSQLLLFLTIISGGIFVKLYLDRHHGSPYTELSTLLTWISPTFAFSTATFMMFKVYTQAAIQSTELRIVSQQLDDIYQVVYSMWCQAVIYLLMTIVMDYYWIELLMFRNHIITNIMHLLVGQQNPTNSPPVIRVPSRTFLHDQQDPDPEKQPLLEKHHHNMKNIRKHHTGLGSNHIPFASSSEEPIEVLAKDSSVHSSTSKDPRCTSNQMIVAENISVQYSFFDNISNLNHMNLRIPYGRKVAIVGMNGGGKTTLFETCALMETIPSEGTLSICGVNMMSHRWAVCDGNTLGYVPQQDGLLEFATMEETLHIFAWIKNIRFTEEFHIMNGSMDHILPMKYYRYPISSMSGGTKKKVAIRIANIASPTLLLLDECTTGVDPIAAKKIVDYLHATVSNHPSQGMLFSSHRIDELLHACEDMLVLVQGKVHSYTTIQHFQQLVIDYYQIDIYLDFSSSSFSDGSSLLMKPKHVITSNEFLELFKIFCHHEIMYERVVIYSKTLVRMTLRKSKLLISMLLTWLLSLQQEQLIANFGFRDMEMEEVLTIFIESTKNSMD